MSEAPAKNRANGLRIAAVDSGSPAERAGLRPGDLLRTLNGRAVPDVLAYQYHSAEADLHIGFEREGAIRSVRLRNPAGLPLGISFESDLGDGIHTCSNKCVFCFIHQMPKRMRRSLYLMDDDFRLSFMHGNYVTLTNVTDAEWARILEERLSPLYVSVHATDPELRGRLLGLRGPAPILPKLRELAENRIDVHAQVVLCPGLNDGEALHRTVHELAEEHPAAADRRSGVLSVAIVPVGLTRFRERLPKLASADRDYAQSMINEVERMARGLRKRLGTRFVWLSDEWYFLAERDVPGMAHYEQFPQLEDGVGTVRLFLEDMRRLARQLPGEATPIKATLVTAELPARVVGRLSSLLNGVRGVETNVCVVRNEWFGGGINIAGLLTAADIRRSLADFPAHGVVCIPDICLKDGRLFLDDVLVEDLAEETGHEVRVVGTRPRALAHALGLAAAPRARRPAGSWVMEAAAQ